MRQTFRTLYCGVLLITLTGTQLIAFEKPRVAGPVKKLILPGESFLIEGRPAFIMLPPKAKRRTPQPWIMYAPTLPAYPDKHEKWMHVRFLAAGVVVAGIDAGEAYGSPCGQKLMSALYKELTEKRGFAKRPCLLGRSRGVLWASSWAIAHCDKVAGLAGIYPVFDLQTYPGIARAAKAYRLTSQELQSHIKDLNPIARADVLVNARIPVCIIHGDDDKVVPLKQNSASLVDRYKQAGAADAVTLIVVKGQGHNFWPGFFRSQRLVDFAIRRANAGATAKTVARRSQHGLFITKNLEYGRAGGKPQLLDLYRPATTSGRLPVVMWVHGGGWKNGSKDRCPATWLTEHGYAVSSIYYRLIDKAQWPAQIDDCRAAIRWLRVNAKRYDLDGSRVGAWGGSAGGHLVALLGTLDAPRNEKVSSRVQAVCDWYGPTDLLTMPPNVLSPGKTLEDLAKSNGAKLLGGTVRDRPSLARQASALYQVSKDDPPFLIVHGEKDPGVPLEQSQRLHKKLKDAGVPSTLHIVKGAGHGGKAFQTREVRKIVLDFFNKNLGSKK